MIRQFMGSICFKTLQKKIYKITIRQNLLLNKTVKKKRNNQNLREHLKLPENKSLKKNKKKRAIRRPKESRKRNEMKSITL